MTGSGTDGRTRVALVFGGRSSEHSISCVTAGGVLGAIDRDRFEVVPVGITRDGAFVLERDDPAAFALDGDALPKVVASGQGRVAEQILEMAFTSGVKVREDADLAELLSVVQLDSEIPADALVAVAEILAYIYRANGTLPAHGGQR